MSPRELDVLNILWRVGEPMTATDIVNAQKGLTQSTVTAVSRKLLREGLIEVAGITRSGKVLSRLYKPTEKSKDCILKHFVEEYSRVKNVIEPDALYEAIKSAKEKDLCVAAN